MRQKALLALLAIGPVNSIGVTIALFVAPGMLGQIAFSLCKIWILVLPGVWVFWVEKERLNISRPKRRETGVGICLGLFMFAAIIGAYWLLGQPWIDVNEAQQKARQVGIMNPQIYWVGAVYYTFVNSGIEEYIWRWFVGRQCERLVPGKYAVFLSAFLFTLHHIIALAAYTDWRTVVLGSLGVFVAASVWSWCYLRYRSLWPSYFSHALADGAIAIASWQILFGV